MTDFPPIISKAYDLACWLLPRVNDFLGGFSDSAFR
jgi:hypothetical protein